MRAKKSGDLVANIRRTFGASLLARISTAAMSVVSLPLILRQLGPEGFAAYAILLGLSSFGAFFEAGFGAAIRSRVAATADEVREARCLPLGVESAMLCLSLLLTIALGLVGLALPWRAFLQLPPGTSSQQLLLMLLGSLLGFTASLWTSVWARCLEGLSLAVPVSLASAAPGVTILITALISIIVDFSLSTFVIVANLSAALPGAICRVVLARAGIRSARVTLRGSAATLRALLPTASAMGVISLSLSLSYASDPIVLGVVAGPTAVADYTVANRVVQLVILVVTSTAPVVWSAAVASRTEGGPTFPTSRLQRLYVAAAVTLSLPLVVLGPWICRVWTGGDLVPSRTLFLAFSSWFIVLAWQMPLAMELNTPAGLRFQASTTSLMAGMNLVLSVLLARAIGISGPVWSSAVCLLLLHALPMTIHRQRRLSIGD